MNPPDEQVSVLVAAADRDIVTYRILRKDSSAPIETTLFHAQQALEKMIKAVLVGRGIVFPRTHDLFQLGDLLVRNGMTSPTSMELMARLAPYAVEFRYLGVKAPEVSLDEADRVVDAVRAWSNEELKA